MMAELGCQAAPHADIPGAEAVQSWSLRGGYMTVGILGFGGYTPDRIMTNSDWSQLVDTTDEWIQQRTGIRTRRVASDDQSTLDLAAAAAAASDRRC